MAEHDPDSLREYKDRFIKERIESELSVGMGEMKTKEELQASHEDDKKRVEGASNVQAQGEQWLGVTKGAADQAGLDKGVTSTLPQQVAEGLGSTEKATGEGRGKIEADGKPIESTVEGNVKDPGSLTARASSNALTSILPQGTTYLLDQVGAAPGSFAKRDAETYKGDTKDALIDTVIWTGTVAVGGGLGAAAGRNIVGATVGKISGKATGEVIGETAGNVVGATLGKEVADNRDGALDLLNGTLDQGKSAIGGLFDGSPGGTGFGNLFGGGTRPAPAQQQPTEGSDGQRQKGDAPPQ
jgi:hypothetical protein